MKEFIKALEILSKYGDTSCPFSAEHDQLFIHAPYSEKFTPEEIAELETYGVYYNEDEGFYKFC